jgi:hypothetical protein
VREAALKAHAPALALLALLATYLLASVEPVLQNGDSAVYNQQVDELDLGVRTTHIGYMALGVAARALMPGLTDAVMNAMTVLVACLGLCAVYLSALRLSGSTAASLLAAAALLAIPAYVRGALLSEVDVPLAAFASVSFAAALHGRVALAGAAFGFAMLISPLAALALPAPLGALWVARSAEPEEPRALALAYARRIAWFAGASLLVYAPVVALNHQDYFWAGRGIFGAPREPFDLAAHAKRSIAFARAQCLFFLPFYAAGIALAFRRQLGVPAFALVVVLLATLVLGDRFRDVPAQLTSVALLSPFIALALPVIEKRAHVALLWAACALAIAWSGWNGLQRAQLEVAQRSDERDVLLALREVSPLRPIVIAPTSGFHNARRIERILFGKKDPGVLLTPGELGQRCTDIAREAQRGIWFLKDVGFKPCSAMKEKYAWSRHSLAGKSVRALLPQ